MTFLLVTLAAYRIQRLLTRDTFPGGLIRDRLDPDRRIHELVSCGWCAGSWITFAVFAVAASVTSVPVPVVQALAGAALVGLISEWESRG